MARLAGKSALITGGGGGRAVIPTALNNIQSK
jgi:hypothetical protein